MKCRQVSGRTEMMAMMTRDRRAQSRGRGGGRVFRGRSSHRKSRFVNQCNAFLDDGVSYLSALAPSLRQNAGGADTDSRCLLFLVGDTCFNAPRLGPCSDFRRPARCPQRMTTKKTGGSSTQTTEGDDQRTTKRVRKQKKKESEGYVSDEGMQRRSEPGTNFCLRDDNGGEEEEGGGTGR